MLSTLAQRSEIKAVVVRGVHGTFSSGSDLTEWAAAESRPMFAFWLSENVGVPRERDLLLTVRLIGAELARSVGLASRVADDDAFDECVAQLLDWLAAQPREALSRQSAAPAGRSSTRGHTCTTRTGAKWTSAISPTAS
jgi:enoyl-CoA hydratase/carnithine racemase